MRKSEMIASYVNNEQQEKLLNDFMNWYNKYIEGNRYNLPMFPLLSIAEKCIQKENQRPKRQDIIKIMFFKKKVKQ
jgi:hypothetical protein